MKSKHQLLQLPRKRWQCALAVKRLRLGSGRASVDGCRPQDLEQPARPPASGSFRKGGENLGAPMGLLSSPRILTHRTPQPQPLWVYS